MKRRGFLASLIALPIVGKVIAQSKPAKTDPLPDPLPYPNLPIAKPPIFLDLKDGDVRLVFEGGRSVVLRGGQASVEYMNRNVEYRGLPAVSRSEMKVENCYIEGSSSLFDEYHKKNKVTIQFIMFGELCEVDGYIMEISATAPLNHAVVHDLRFHIELPYRIHPLV